MVNGVNTLNLLEKECFGKEKDLLPKNKLKKYVSMAEPGQKHTSAKRNSHWFESNSPNNVLYLLKLKNVPVV